jgi:hypothetical protein
VAVLKISFFAIYLVGCVLYLVYTAAVGGSWMMAFYAFIFGTGILAAILMRRWHRSQDELLNQSLTGQPNRGLNGVFSLQSGVRAYLEERAFITASLLARGASEIQIHRNQAHNSGEVLARQTLNTFLRVRNLWEKLERAEADLASVADGLWTSEQEGYVVVWCEQLRLLRWVLGIDPEIVPLWHCPGLDFRLSWDLLQRGTAVNDRRVEIGPWDIRMQRDLATDYMARIIAELKARGIVPAGPELDGWADELRAKSLGASVDLLAGTRTIAEISDDGLRCLVVLAAARGRYASYLVDQLNAPTPFAFSSWDADHSLPV